jgi:tripartite-type tricarboxylate transporter receptor subunit TctC
MVRSDAPWKTLKEFVEYAKKNPGKITYAHSGLLRHIYISGNMYIQSRR